MADMIHRHPEQAGGAHYDLIVIGAGVYGICLALEAARRGLRPLLLERDDFGGATSWNSLRILHGGLRYLQSLDLPRFCESVAERRWFCQHLPELVEPLPCVMPLFGRGLKRMSVFHRALQLNDWLSRHRNDGVPIERHLPNGRLLDASETLRRCPGIETHGLQGAGLWHDVVMPSPQRVLIELLRWACACGATALNYVEAIGLTQQSGRVAGMVGRDKVSGQTLRFASPLIVNAAGPWSREVARQLDHDVARLFQPTLAFNVLLEVAPLPQAALAVQPQRPTGPVYFVYPLRGRLFAGTFHAAWRGGPEAPAPTEQQLEQMLSDLRRALPGMALRREHIVRINCGLLPGARAGGRALSVRDVLHDHGRHGGPHGLYSLAGVKFTTARAVAERTLRTIWRGRGGLLGYQPNSGRTSPGRALDMLDPSPLAEHDAAQVAALRKLAAEEAVVQFDDLWLRRTDWATVMPGVEAEGLKQRLRQHLKWNDPKHVQPSDAAVLGCGEESRS